MQTGSGKARLRKLKVCVIKSVKRLQMRCLHYFSSRPIDLVWCSVVRRAVVVMERRGGDGAYIHFTMPRLTPYYEQRATKEQDSFLAKAVLQIDTSKPADCLKCTVDGNGNNLSSDKIRLC